jgi:hypothetical protein
VTEARPDRPHTTHDLALIAAAAADDLAGAAVREAAELIATCEECRTLHADLVAIAAATRALPEPIRPRSFTLSTEQAERLRPTGWRRLSGLRLDQRRLTRPMAIACTTLGLAGLLLAALPSAPLGLLSFGGGAAAPAATDTGSMRIETDDDGAAAEDASGSPIPVFGQAGSWSDGPKSTPGAPSSLSPEGAPAPSSAVSERDDDAPTSPTSPAAEVTTGTPAQWLVVLSLALLAGGLGLFVLSRERRRTD